MISKYHVQWDCPHCGTKHNWWWEDKDEAFSEDEIEMTCDRCSARVTCQGDGSGFYEPIATAKQRDLRSINAAIDELQKLICRTLAAETAIADLKEKVNVLTYAKPSVKIGEKRPFHERLREGCEFNKETLNNLCLGRILRFIAVEAENMAKDGLSVGDQLRKLANEAELTDFCGSDDYTDGFCFHDFLEGEEKEEAIYIAGKVCYD